MSFTEKGEFSCKKLFVIQSFGWYVSILSASDEGFTEEFFFKSWQQHAFLAALWPKFSTHTLAQPCKLIMNS